MNKKIIREKRIQSQTVTSPSHKKGSTPTIAQLLQGKIIAVFIFVFLIITLTTLVWFKSYQPQPTKKTITVYKQVLQRRSRDTGIINRGLTGKAVDVNTGKVVTAARIFSPDDKTVYLELDFNNAPKGTVIDYIRYKKGRYVDHGEITLTKDKTQNTLFNWTLNNLLSNIRDGQWRITTYANGILAKRIIYEVKNNKVSYVYPNQPINPTDPDFYLSHALSVREKDK